MIVNMRVKAVYGDMTTRKHDISIPITQANFDYIGWAQALDWALSKANGEALISISIVSCNVE